MGSAQTYTDRGRRQSRRMELYFRGQDALARNRPQEAIALFQEAVKERAVFWFLDSLDTCVADAYLRTSRVDQAIAEYQRLLETFPGEALARYHLAAAFERAGRREEALSEYRRFLEQWKNADPDIPEVAMARKRIGT